jgi:hypothetical protein
MDLGIGKMGSMGDSGMSVEERWAQPLSLDALGNLTAQWLEGSVHWSPWEGGSPPDSETLPLVPSLAAMNRLGFLTDFSQPGIPDYQRASVTGFCNKAQAECLASISLDGELVVLTEYPGVEATYELPITQDEGRAFTVLPGRPIMDETLGLHPHTLALLADCHYVSICDPRWGRDDVLWASTVAALRRDPGACTGSLVDPTAN